MYIFEYDPHYDEEVAVWIPDPPNETPLFHVSTVPGLTVLEPRVPEETAVGEPDFDDPADGAVVCAAASVEDCLAALKVKQSDLPQCLYVYEIVEEDLYKFYHCAGRNWFDADKEYRSAEPVRVKFLKTLNLGGEKDGKNNFSTSSRMD